MQAAIITEGDHFAVVPVSDIVKISQLQRQFLHLKAGHQHLHRRGIRHGFQTMSLHSGRQGFQLRQALQQMCFHGGPVLFIQGPVINDHRRDIPFQVTLHEGSHGRIIGVEPGSQHHAVQPDLRLQPVAAAAFQAIQEELGAVLPHPGADRKEMESPKRAFRRPQQVVNQHILAARRPGGFDIDHGKPRSPQKSEVHIHPMRVITTRRGGGRKHRGEPAGIRLGCGENKESDFSGQLVPALQKQKIILTIKPPECGAPIRNQRGSAFRDGLHEMPLTPDTVVEEINALSRPQGRHGGLLPPGILQGRVQMG